MPLIPIIIAAGVGVAGGFVVGKGAEGMGNIVKWGVVGGAGFLVARHMKWI